MSKLRKIKRIIAMVVLPLVLFLLYNSTSNLHYHKLSNGQIITHAHPYSNNTDNTPLQKHKHTKIQYFFFHNITFWAFTLVSIFILSILLCSSKKRELIQSFQLKITTHLLHIFLRGPPEFSTK
ncbi:MAG: hypothetical protein PF487_02345 [Bacteroidales bacterium]|jgi:hypothetical protein|nr:hypothetical protein [Bacteroidales bacterium]